MKRSNFLKSLIGLVVAPKLIGEVDWSEKTVEQVKMNRIITRAAPTGKLMQDLQLLTPHYYKQFASKYGKEFSNVYT